MTFPLILDLYCCQGGASAGYAAAGFEVVGIDLDPQPRYPYPFLRADALESMRTLLSGGSLQFMQGDTSQMLGLEDFDAIHASPPCQLYSLTHRINKSDFPDLIGITRDLLLETDLPYVIENVQEARPELREPILLCGTMFKLETYRHRLFEMNWGGEQPQHPHHTARTTKRGRAPIEGEFMHIVGNFSGVGRGREIMGMPWANRDGLREAIPPIYATWVGAQMVDQVLLGATAS